MRLFPLLSQNSDLILFQYRRKKSSYTFEVFTLLSVVVQTNRETGTLDLHGSMLGKCEETSKNVK